MRLGFEMRLGLGLGVGFEMVWDLRNPWGCETRCTVFVVEKHKVEYQK